MKYIWVLLGLFATVAWIHGIWTNSLDACSKSLVSVILTISLIDFSLRTLERNK